MKTFKIKISDKKSNRFKDANGYLHIRDNPIAKAGVFDYLRGEVQECAQDKANEIVKVCRKFDDLVAIKDKFSKMPIMLDHKWVGEDSDVVAGAIGEKITAQEPYLIADLIIYSKELIDAIENDKITELSPAYITNTIPQSGEYNGEPYEFVQERYEVVNHLAVVENGRSGHDLRIQDDSKIKPKTKKGEKMGLQKIADALAGMLKRIKDEEGVEPTKQEDSVEDIQGKILEISMKPSEEFEGGEEEKKKLIMELSQKLAEAQKSEPATQEDNDGEGEGEKKPQEDNDGEEEKALEKVADSISKIIDAKLNGIEKKQEAKKTEDASAYLEVSKVVGDFNHANMSAKEIYAHGYKCLAGRTLDSGIDAKSAFVVKASELKPIHKQEDGSVSSKMSDSHINLLKNIK